MKHLSKRENVTDGGRPGSRAKDVAVGRDDRRAPQPARPVEPLPPGGSGVHGAVGQGRVLAERERRFVEHYMGAAGGNATRAARMAGYAKTTAEKQASRLLGKVGVQEAIQARVKADPAVWTREERQRFWTAVASGAPGYEGAPLRDRLKASELLGRSQADFVERVEHAGTVTLEQVLAASRPNPEARRG